MDAYNFTERIHPRFVRLLVTAPKISTLSSNRPTARVCGTRRFSGGVYAYVDQDVRNKKYGKLRVATGNVKSMTDRNSELAGILGKRNVNVTCVQDIQWKRDKTEKIGNGYMQG